MGFFSKKKEKEDRPDFKFNLNEDFPKYESKIGMEEGARIKEAISDFSPVPMMPKPSVSKPVGSLHEINGRVKQGKTLFVKIDKYRDVVRTLDKIKGKLEDSERILGKLSDLKKEEDKELETWHVDLQDLKEKLLEIDSTLFEE